MKKLLTLAVAIVATIVLVACGPKVDMDTVLEHEGTTYVATGQFAGWADAAKDPKYNMTATNRGDSRLSSIVDELTDAKYIYVYEVTFSAEDAGWENTFTFNGEDKTFNGNLSFKVIQAPTAEELIPSWWGQSPESGKFANLTPSTLFVPPFQQEPEGNSGAWNDNLFVAEAGKYLMIYVQYAANSHAVGAIALNK